MDVAVVAVARYPTFPAPRLIAFGISVVSKNFALGTIEFGADLLGVAFPHASVTCRLRAMILGMSWNLAVQTKSNRTESLIMSKNLAIFALLALFSRMSNLSTIRTDRNLLIMKCIGDLNSIFAIFINDTCESHLSTCLLICSNIGNDCLHLHLKTLVD